MMKSIFFGIVALMFAAVVMHQEQASVLAEESSSPRQTTAGGSDKWNKMANDCLNKLNDQIKMEFEAAIFYMQYAAYFGQASVNLPGFEKFFFNAASEEREHGIKLMEYAHMRGQKLNVGSLNVDPKVELNKEKGALKALENALEKEQTVTASIRELIIACENPRKENYNDYHLVDYLTGEFLEEQHKGQRELAGKIAMLKKMLETNPHLGEFIFDNQNM